jgi:hypothetical protein
MCEKAILGYFDNDLYDELREQEATERKEYQQTLKKFVMKMKLEKDDKKDE